jgi:hypothetical protein
MVKLTVCKRCGIPCEKVGNKKRIGVTKSYCCICFAPHDQKFTQSYYCDKCKERSVLTSNDIEEEDYRFCIPS